MQVLDVTELSFGPIRALLFGLGTPGRTYEERELVRTLILLHSTPHIDIPENVGFLTGSWTMQTIGFPKAFRLLLDHVDRLPTRYKQYAADELRSQADNIESMIPEEES